MKLIVSTKILGIPKQVMPLRSSYWFLSKQFQHRGSHRWPFLFKLWLSLLKKQTWNIILVHGSLKGFSHEKTILFQNYGVVITVEATDYVSKSQIWPFSTEYLCGYVDNCCRECCRGQTCSHIYSTALTIIPQLKSMVYVYDRPWPWVVWLRPQLHYSLFICTKAEHITESSYLFYLNGLKVRKLTLDWNH